MKRLVFLLLLIPNIAYAEKLTISVNKPIDPAILTDELSDKFKSSGIHSIEYDQVNKKVIVDFPNGAPQQSQVQDVLSDHDSTKQKNKDKKDRDDAIDKLKGLGLTQPEINALLRH